MIDLLRERAALLADMEVSPDVEPVGDITDPGIARAEVSLRRCAHLHAAPPCHVVSESRQKYFCCTTKWLTPSVTVLTHEQQSYILSRQSSCLKELAGKDSSPPFRHLERPAPHAMRVDALPGALSRHESGTLVSRGSIG